ncbi:MAG TPA: 4-hydroxy-3-methylbut-2-enyl diphosphate reductase [Bacteroidales bacterium]|nr:4-hydroxy-3-methylbut-2-enyl diphosphate reductase [Bacteroidales bacterium]
MIKERRLQLKAEIDRRSGFCFGVVKAIEKAEALLNQGQRVYCVGQIVHNDEEVNRLKEKGLITIGFEDIRELKGENILFRAHGEPPDTYEQVRKHNNVLVDATCPIVLKLQRDVHQAWLRGKQVFIFGKAGHPEVKGLAGQTNGRARVFRTLEELKELELPRALTLFSQTTMNPEAFKTVVSYIKDRGIEVEERDTICRQVSGREEDMKTFSRNHDRIVFVAGQHSSNGKMLYEVCRSNNPYTHFISRTDELDRSWFSPRETVGVCGATSTPQWLLEEVKQKIESF